MKRCTENVVEFLKGKNLSVIPARSDEKVDVLDFPWEGKNLKCIFTGDEGEYLSLYYYLEVAPEDKYADVLMVCNGMNAKYKWVKFYIDSDNDITLQDDAILNINNAGDETLELIVRMIDILKNTKPAFMRAIYS